ncbi:fasciclin domain-containing protein [Falsiroseomonas sp. E2-1-a20]|uniref:fasciclin domain-containing protein n=1 Tax=Falsiroseomonas sp. E2-1-a20 TaxID=3239300 RepID=UPI003F416A4B
MSTRIPVLRATLLATALAAVMAPVAHAQTRSCVDTLASMPEFSRFTNGIVASRVTMDLRTTNDITIFAPTNEAVARLNQITVDRLFPAGDGGSRQADASAAPAAVGAHVLQGRRDAATLAQGGQFTSVSGTPLVVTASGGAVTVKGGGNTEARVTRPDIACSNGVIHGIDTVLVR